MLLSQPRCESAARLGTALIPLLLIWVLAFHQSCLASPSQEFYERNSEIYDKWGICRTRASGDDGFFQASRSSFRPTIAFESLGPEAERAYELGGKFAEKYKDDNRLAEAIFLFVRDGVRYTSDLDQFGYREYAQNADELIRTLGDGSFAEGDCEDYAILLAVMWKGAGLRSAIVLASNHAAALVYLPGYRNANMVWELNGEEGWIWAEATGSNNPLGWAPDEYFKKSLLANEVTDRATETPELPQQPPGEVTDFTRKGGNPVLQISPFFSLIFFMWLVSAAARAFRGTT